MAGQASDRFSHAVRNSRIASVFASAFGLLVVIGAQTLDFYSVESTAADGGTTTSTRPLVSDPTPGQWVLLLLPLIATLAVAALVYFAIERDSHRLLVAAWVPAALTTLGCVAAAASIGLWVIPFAVALVLSVFFAQHAFDLHRAEPT